jgi:uroporphyrinogen-III synthase
MTTRSGLVVFSGGKPFDFEELFRSKGFGLRTVASHRIELTSTTFPFGKRIDRVVFTSRNSVRALVRAGTPFLPGAIVHAVGPATAQALREAGVEPSAPTGAASAEGLLAGLPENLGGESIFWPHGEDSDESLAAGLRRRGADVLAPVVYRKEPLPFPEDLPEEIRRGGFGAYACTSGAAARWLAANLDRPEKEALLPLPAAALGAPTARELSALGARRVAVSPEASFESLAATLLRLLEAA